MKGIIWNDESLGANLNEVEIPEDLKEKLKNIEKN